MFACCEASEQFGIDSGNTEGVEDDILEDPHAEGVTTDMDCEQYKKCCCDDGGGGDIPFNPDDPDPGPDPKVIGYNGVWLFTPYNSSSSEDEKEDDESHAEHPEDDMLCFDEEGMEIPCIDDDDDPSKVEPEEEVNIEDIDTGPCYDEAGNEIPCDEPEICFDDAGDEVPCPEPDIENPVELDEERPCKKPRPDGSCECYVGDPNCDSDHEDYIRPPIGGGYNPDNDTKPPIGGGYDPDNDPPTNPPDTDPPDNPPTDPPTDPPEDDPPTNPPEDDPPTNPPEDDPPTNPPTNPPTDPPTNPTPDPLEEGLPNKSCEEELFDIINKYRIEKGLPVLAWDERLYTAAHMLARENDSTGNGGNHFADGDVYTRARLAGFDNPTVVAENAWYSADFTCGTEGAPKEALTAWMASPDHNENLLRDFNVGTVAWVGGAPVFLTGNTDIQTEYTLSSPATLTAQPSASELLGVKSKIDGKRICYIIDKSGSIEGLAWAVVRFELMRSIRGLAANTLFTVLLFSDYTEPIYELGTYTNKSSSGYVEKWLSLHTPQGGTDPLEVIQYVFRGIGTGFSVLAPKPDVVFLFTDGVYPDYNIRRRQLTRLNNELANPISVNPITLQGNQPVDDGMRASLHQMAKDNNGNSGVPDISDYQNLGS